MKDIVYWIWLSLCCTPDTSTFPKLIAKFGDAQSIYEATDKEISSCIGHNTSDRSALLKRNMDEAQKVYEFCVKHKVGIVTYASDEYPKSLKDIPTPPVLLYYRGKLPDFNKSFMVATVGTRTLSDYGRNAAFRISYDLALAGATIVSGMAIGIDSVALAGALSAGKSVVAVIGSGIDICYPSGHLTLAREIVKEGCVLTEYAPGTPPGRFNFPKRNRIISGLSSATLVVEGKEKSGALITARYAKEQGRAVYALPGNVGSPNSEVTNLLIKNGARLCTCADDIVKDFDKSLPGVLNPFALKSGITYDVMGALAKYSVIAVCPSDDIFTPPRPKRKVIDRASNKDENIDAGKSKDTSNVPGDDFDPRAIALYKKIPADGACSIESLVDDTTSMREIMKLLLKLEVGKFIVMLPGDSVARKA